MNEIKFKGEKERYRILIIVILLSFSCLLIYYFHALLQTEVVYSHFLYIPIILASLWWSKKGLVVAVLLALLLVLSHTSGIGQDMEFINDLTRASMFIVIAAVVSILSERITKAEVDREYTKNLEEMVEERTKEIKKLSDAVKASTESIIISDLEGKIIDVNEASVKMYGAGNKEDLVGKSSFDLIAPEDRERAFAGMKEVMEKGYVKDRKYHVATKNGSKLPVEMSVSIIKDADGEPERFVGVTKDISERKRTEETLIQSEKLRVLGEMAAGVAHDFNNLLAIILGNAQLLEKGMEKYKAEEIKERLKTIARTAYEGGATVKRLQHFTGTEVSTHDFTKLDLNEIVREAIASTSPRWKDEAEAKGTTIKIKEKLEKLPSLLGSRSELIEVLTNLIFNSLEAMPEGGEITMRTEAKENKVYLYFTDSGKGIPNRIKKKIFDPFFTTKGSRSSGLGLSVSYGIIKHHKGEIKVESSKEKGTTFTISIPIYLEAPLKKEKVKDAEKISPKKILVVDDEEGIREVLKTILQDEGHRVVLAETARKGLARFKQDNFDWALTGLEDNFDLVLTDLGMSEMSGWQLAKKIKGMDSDVPVGLITGWGVAPTKEKMKETGVDFILSKPFDYTKVVREVNSVLKSKKR